ncbi:MAG: hypothetical protein QNJ68_22240 [Microcoleaceae cyanobacterium MO_207.B10]|nr:hypothetical protein [Microcoleaceae cyanobacterium MO_207.B10]
MVSKSKSNYAMADIEGLKLKHQGSNRYLSEQELQEVIEYLKSKKKYPKSDSKL